MSIALVQQVYHRDTYGTTHTVTIAAPAAGNTLVICSENPNGATITGITGGGVTWSKAVSSSVNSDAELWVGPNSSGAGTTITITTTASASLVTNVSEWSGMPATLATDGTNSAHAQSASVSAGSVTPTAGKPVLIISAAAMISDNLPTSGPTNGFTELATDGSGDTLHAFAYLIVASASGSYSTTWGAAHAYDKWDAVIAAFDGTAVASVPNLVAPVYQDLMSPVTNVIGY